MGVKEVIDSRRAYRSLEPFEVTEAMLDELFTSIGLTPSCFNNQPWRYVAVHDQGQLVKLHDALSEGNQWAKAGSMIVAVCTKGELDCVIRDRIYSHFDTGMATAFMILRATEMGLVAHPIAGFSQTKVKQILGVPEDVQVIALVIFGKHSDELNPTLSAKQRGTEKKRPVRKPLAEYLFHNWWS